jgi:hypothetical protein
MNREALKFTDLNTFLSVMEEKGYNGELKDFIFEQDKPPYCSAYFIPLHQLPESFDLESIDKFGGTMARVEEIHYVGTERFTADFMIFPLSRTGYVEVGIPAPTTFVQEMVPTKWTTEEMNYVINLEDGGGQEFFLTAAGKLVGMATVSQEQPQEFKTFKQAAKKISQITEKYPATCQLYVMELREFQARQKVLQPTEPD